jgi:hypothetical protein
MKYRRETEWHHYDKTRDPAENFDKGSREKRAQTAQ